MATQNHRPYLLPIIALLAVAAAVVVFFAKPSGDAQPPVAPEQPPAPPEAVTATLPQPAEQVEVTALEETTPGLEMDEQGNLVIRAETLSSDQVAFLKVPGDSRIELLARRGEDGKAQVALGTCQSCGGSPRAYYTQVDNYLRCNNCGQRFKLSVLGARSGGGCRPISLDAEVVHESGNDLLLDRKALERYEPLFANVAPH